MIEWLVSGRRERTQQSSEEIVSASRQNFILERELDVLDEKTKLLIRNRITVHEVVLSSSGLQATGSNESQRNAQITEKRGIYEYILYDPTEARFIPDSADVVFNEDEFPFEHLSPDDPQHDFGIDHSLADDLDYIPSDDDATGADIERQPSQSMH